MRASRISMPLLALLAAGLIAAGCGGDDDRSNGGEGGGGAGITSPVEGDTGSSETEAVGVYDTCVETAQYATEEQIEGACAQVQQEYEDCVQSGETGLGTPATPEECVSAALPTS